MLKSKIEELKTKVEEARQELLKAVTDKYIYAVNVGEKANEYIVLLAQLEVLEEIEE